MSTTFPVTRAPGIITTIELLKNSSTNFFQIFNKEKKELIPKITASLRGKFYIITKKRK